MFRKLLPLVILLHPVTLYAMSCPSSSEEFLEVGDTKEHVINVCGKPTSVEKVDKDVLIDGELIYKKPSGPNVTFTIREQSVSKIEVPLLCNEPPCDEDAKEVVSFYEGCYQYIYINNNVPFVLHNCGVPTSTKAEKIIPDTTEKLVYPSIAGPNVLIIHNGVLTDWETQ